MNSFLPWTWRCLGVALLLAGCGDATPAREVPVAALDTSGLHGGALPAADAHMGHGTPPPPTDAAPMAMAPIPQGVVQIDPVTVQNIGVRTTEVAIQALERTARTTGRFEMDERGSYTVSLKVGGWVERLFVDYEGAIVRQGQPLLELYSPELVATQEEYLLALRNAHRAASNPQPQVQADAQRLLEAARRRLAYWDISDAQIERLEATGQPDRTFTFYAPASGEVMQKKVVEGQRLEAGAPLMQINDLSQIWLIVDVYEQDLGWVREGTRAVVSLPYTPGAAYRGRVDYVYPMLNRETRAGQARIIFSGAPRTLRPGMYAVATLYGGTAEPMPVVPEEAVLRTGTQTLVIEALGQGRFQPRLVETGFGAEGWVQVLEGLAGGESVVTRAQFLIDSEARLQGAVGAMLGGHDH